MNWLVSILTLSATKLADEHIKDYRESKARVYDTILKTNTHINQIILTASVASLAAVAALNKEVFGPYALLSFNVVALFVLVILLSIVNLYLTALVLQDIQKQLNINWQSLSRLNKNIENQRFEKIRKYINAMIFGGFCFGLLTFLILLGFYMLGGEK